MYLPLSRWKGFCLHLEYMKKRHVFPVHLLKLQMSTDGESWLEGDLAGVCGGLKHIVHMEGAGSLARQIRSIICLLRK